jgi:hypothetical protein
VFSALAATAGSLYFAADPEGVRRRGFCGGAGHRRNGCHAAGVPAVAGTSTLVGHRVLCCDVRPDRHGRPAGQSTVPGVGQLRLLIGATIIRAAAYLVFIGLVAVPATMVLLLVLATGLNLFSLADAISNALAGNVMLSFAPATSSGRHASLLQTASALALTVAPGIYARLFTVARTLPWGFSAVLLVVSAAAYIGVHRSRLGR